MGPAGYEIVQELCRDERFVVLRGRRLGDGATVLLKGPARLPVRRADLEALRCEHALLKDLAVAGLPKARELIRDEAGLWLAIEDLGGGPLGSLLGGPLGLDAFFDLAIPLAAILAELHDRDVIHKNLNPRTVFIDPAARRVWLADLTLAVRGASETSSSPAPLSGPDFAYVSPEQSGRMNRAVDHRSDLYSLGVTLYEALTGVPPFRSADPLELIHAHIAKSPVPPAQQHPGIPEVLSTLVMKLLEKTADARYQSARGLQADLEACAREWRERGSIPRFPLGAQDFSDRFLIPQRLYGRDREVEELKAAFEGTCSGPAALVLVAGYSGIGKTSLIQELYRPIVRQRGHFISGKFDLVARNIPYGALIQAFRGLVQQLLTESEARLAEWKERLAAALGENGSVLTEVIPELELILGPQAPVPALPAAETQNRFRLVFQSFVSALADEAHPLALFLDDLQRADAASLALLQPLLTSPEVRSLLIIGAYRDNEVDASHLLTRTVQGLEASGARLERILLGPLPLADVRSLVADCLKGDDEDTASLAELVTAKTEGNPFFVIQFLKSAWQEGLLRFDPAGRRFCFRLEEIEKAPMTQNVIDLMSRKLQRLSPRAQRVLTLAACVGNRFDLATLAIVSEQPPEAAFAQLREALDEGLLLRSASYATASPDPDGPEHAYEFLHDRVQQAAYARLPEDSRRRLHLAVGRLLLERWDRARAEEKVFDIVSHLNLGCRLIEDPAERLALASLNATAGRRAKSSTAYQAALGYFRAGLELLPQTLWAADYELAFDLSREAAECEYLCGQFEEAERSFAELMGRARTALDKAQVHNIRLVQFENLSRYAEATRIGREGLALLGVSLPPDETGQREALEAELQTIEELLAGRSIASLVELPVLHDSEQRLVMRLLTDLWAPAYILGNATLVALVSARLVSLSIRHGNTEDSAYGYVTHAITVGPLRGDYRAAYEWGALALAVNDRFGDQKRRAKIHQQFNAHVTLWRRPLATCIPHAQEACRSGLQTGDFTYAGYGAFTESWPAFLTSRDLERFVRDFTPTLGVLRRIRTLGLHDAHRLMLNWARALQGRTQGPLTLSDESFDEAAYVAAHHANPFFMTVLHIARLHLAVLFEDRPAALSAERRARELGPWGKGTIWPVLLDFWGGLALAMDGAAASRSGGERLTGARDRLRLLADNCAENYRCFALLLDAELARTAGRGLEALELYDEAVRYARETDNLQQEALSLELAGRLWLERGHDRVAAEYLADARRSYAAWGAQAKVRQLDQRHPVLRRAGQREEAPSFDVKSVTKAAHALSGEIVLEELLRRLMRIALENAGAERGFLLHEQEGQLVIEAQAGVDGQDVSLPGSLPLDEPATLSRAVVQFVRKTLTSVVVGDATRDERFAADPYVAKARPRSILCIPLVHQGTLGGILYLENSLAKDAFTADRIEVLDVLAGQAAISLENARLYREKTREIERRRRAEEELRRALEEVESLKNRLLAENVYLQEEIRREHNFEEMVGNSPALLEVLRKVERVAPTDSIVLVGGETGTGKELIARAIHNRSARKDRPLVKVNCGAIAAGLVESELFGHVRGAFTGALDKRVGRFELANGGTVFLDEVGELPPETQVKLLRVLQEQEFEPVGSSRTVKVDVRVIAATNRDLADAMREGRFRSDLYFRLNVFPLNVPPLRDRRSDIPALVAYFLSRFSRKFGKAVEGVSRETMDRLVSYAWPGNVRELQNVIERAVVLASGSMLVLDPDLLPAMPAVRRDPENPAVAPGGAAAAGRELDEVERSHIRQVLESTAGVIEGPRGAARVLGLHPNTLRSRMKRLGVRRSHEIS
ncbi:MAG TPA: sigma 54-interacting transcriptional regulator [Vicinamibacteria bacterium]|nr:sigma 54-interacting transcriptional regulator [Vicinamibacteria bacterium]